MRSEQGRRERWGRGGQKLARGRASQSERPRAGGSVGLGPAAARASPIPGRCRAAVGEKRHRRAPQGAELAAGQALTRPLSHPPQPGSDARYGSQGQPPACLDPVAGSNTLGPQGEASISSQAWETETRRTEWRPRLKIRSGRGRRPRGAWRSWPRPAGAPSNPPCTLVPWRRRLTSPRSSPCLAASRLGTPGGRWDSRGVCARAFPASRQWAPPVLGKGRAGGCQVVPALGWLPPRPLPSLTSCCTTCQHAPTSPAFVPGTPATVKYPSFLPLIRTRTYTHTSARPCPALPGSAALLLCLGLSLPVS